jgi:DNA-binding NtrC family response regulator
VTTADAISAQELNNLIAQCKIRIEQQRIHAKELSGDPPQQKHALQELVAAIASLAKLRKLRKHFTKQHIKHRAHRQSLTSRWLPSHLPR